MPNTVRLHRVLTTKPDKVYRAFIEADAMAKWLPPNGFTCTVHQLEPKVGGSHRMSFRNFTTGASHSFGGQYLELVPGEAREQRGGLAVQRLQAGVAHPVPALELADEQLGVGPHAHRRRSEAERGLEARDERPVLGHVVRRDPDALAHRGEHGRRVGRGIEHHRADRGRTRVAAGSPVAEHVDGLDRRRLGRAHGTRMAPQLSQRDSPGTPRWIRSTSVAGMLSRQPWQVPPTRRATPTPWARARICS